MQLSEQTLTILKNFKDIQSNIVFTPGNVLSTVSDSKTVLASAKLDIEIEQEFGIFDLSEFLGTLNLVDSPELKLSKNYAEITSKSGRSRVKYYFADIDLLTHPRSLKQAPDGEVNFVLDNETMYRLKKAAATLGHDKLLVEYVQGAISLSVTDQEDATSNSFSIDVAGEVENENFKFIIPMDNLKLLPLDYDVTLSKKFYGKFTSKDANYDVNYLVGMGDKSTYDE